MNDYTCSVDGCGRDAHNKKRKLCVGHYTQFLRGQTFKPIGHRRRGKCTFDGCDNDHAAKGLCIRHYNQSRWSRGLRPLGPERIPAAARDAEGNKRCSKCFVWKPEADFQKSKNRPDGLQHMCRECKADHYRKNADAVRDNMRKQRFGITREEFDALFIAQGERCAICLGDDPGSAFWSVDHDHACCPGSEKTCGKCIRGILCARCNHALGHARDSVEVLSAMIAYLGNHGSANKG